MALPFDMKEAACKAIDEAADELNSISQAIWGKPELKMEEHNAHDVLTSFLERWRFCVEKRHILPTAWRAQYTPMNGTEDR